MTGAAGRPGFFLDRDGTLIHDRHYLARPEGVELLPTVGLAVARLNRAGVPVIAISNQSGIGRGLFSEEDLAAVQSRVEELLAGEGARLDGFYFCPHSPEDGCACRKPGLALFRKAAAEHRLDLSASFFVGDRARDVTPSLAFGATPMLVTAGARPRGEAEQLPEGTLVFETLEAAVFHTLARLRAG